MSAVTGGKGGRVSCRQAAIRQGSLQVGGAACGERGLASLLHDKHALASHVTVRLRAAAC